MCALQMNIASLKVVDAVAKVTKVAKVKADILPFCTKKG